MALISRKMAVQLGIKTDVDVTGANLHILMLALNRPATRQFGWVARKARVAEAGRQDSAGRDPAATYRFDRAIGDSRTDG